jgi:hypothetical protein
MKNLADIEGYGLSKSSEPVPLPLGLIGGMFWADPVQAVPMLPSPTTCKPLGCGWLLPAFS